MELPSNIYGLGGAILAFVIAMAGLWQKRQRPKAGAEDAVYEINIATITRQEHEIIALKEELRVVREERNKFDIALAHSNASLEIATAALEATKQALARAIQDHKEAHDSWESAQRYLWIVRRWAATNNLELPPETK